MEIVRKAFQVLLGLALGYAGIGHLTTSRQEFQAQVPTVFAGGVVEVPGSGWLGSCSVFCGDLSGKYFPVCKWG